MNETTETPTQLSGAEAEEPQTTEAPAQIENVDVLAEGMREDPRMTGIKEGLVDEWRQQNGSEWTANQNGGQDLRGDFQDWMYGSNEGWKNGKPPTLDSRTEDRFRELHPKDAQKYDEMERVRVYDNPRSDPAFSQLDAEIIKATNTDGDVTNALNQGRRRFGESPTEVWNRANSRATLTTYRSFAQQYPEKAQAYAAQIPILKSILEAQNRAATQQGVETHITEPNNDSPQESDLPSELGETGLLAPAEELSPNNPELQETPDKGEVDARDYFRGTAFQKEAEQIDPDKSSPWQTTRGDGVLFSDDEGKVALAETYDAEEVDPDNRVGVLLAEQDKSGEGSSAYIRNKLPPPIRGQITDVVNDVSPRLSGESRHTFIRTLIKLLPSLENQADEVVAETLTTLALRLVPDHASGIEATELPQFDGASQNQQEQLNRLLKLASKKLPIEQFSKKLEELRKNLQFTDGAFDSNYPSTITSIRNLVFNSREDTKRNYDVMRRQDTVDYPVKDKITHDFSSQDELENRLGSLPVEPMPDVRLAQRSRQQAEIVDLEKVVGGTSITDWTVSTSENRGVGKIFELSQAFKDESVSVAGNNQPIQVVEVGGKYFVESDGRHRTAALKALGVDKVPMLVTHIEE